MGLDRRSEIEKNEEIIDKTNFYHLWLDLSPLVAADTVVLKGDLFVDQKKPDGLGKSADIEVGEFQCHFDESRELSTCKTNICRTSKLGDVVVFEAIEIGKGKERKKSVENWSMGARLL